MSLFDKENLAGFREDLAIDFSCFGKHYHFKTTWGIFSPKQIDDGSRLLLDHIKINPDDQILDFRSDS